MTADHQGWSPLSSYEGVLGRVLVRAGVTVSGWESPSRAGLRHLLCATVSLGTTNSKKARKHDGYIERRDPDQTPAHFQSGIQMPEDIRVKEHSSHSDSATTYQSRPTFDRAH